MPGEARGPGQTDQAGGRVEGLPALRDEGLVSIKIRCPMEGCGQAMVLLEEAEPPAYVCRGKDHTATLMTHVMGRTPPTLVRWEEAEEVWSGYRIEDDWKGALRERGWGRGGRGQVSERPAPVVPSVPIGDAAHSDRARREPAKDVPEVQESPRSRRSRGEKFQPPARRGGEAE